ncbi:citrate synthase/methylcitrate synthase [Pseudalkalibacillus decolorationis]|uniref:citrate synthase/methylcitrate synthase n=1 Tax=Pseudalkalibacillus decolorationis TaxID=163879 RepID=UPI0021489367|nr:citrate synthase/methylcitrate synthase [Pseudalkalibacillus decolorationis]
MLQKGLEGIVAAQSTISLVDGEKGHLVYRGYWAKELAQKNSFEEIAYLLWEKRLPDQKELCEFKEGLKCQRELTSHEENILRELPEKMEMMSVIRTIISSTGTSDYQWPSSREQAIRVSSIIPTIIAKRHRLQQGKSPIKPDMELDHVANYLYMLTGSMPLNEHVKALTGYLILTMEHGMNASTFAARVIASTQSDLISSLTGAIGAMKGPLHGGAPSGVINLLDQIGSIEHTESCLRQQLEDGQRLMGFGHRVYKTQDPRAEALREITLSLATADPWFELANHVEKIAIQLLEEHKPGRRLYTNVEFYAAAILRAVSLPPELFTSTFTLSRTIGWIAHIFEQNENNRIIRPSSEYVGPLPV